MEIHKWLIEKTSCKEKLKIQLSLSVLHLYYKKKIEVEKFFIRMYENKNYNEGK